MMRAMIAAVALQAAVAMNLGIHVHHRPSGRPHILLSEGVIPGVDADEVENCVVEAENPAEASACADPPLDPNRPKLAKWEIEGYLDSGEGNPQVDGRRGTHGLDECLAEAENAQETADCYADYNVTPPV